MWLYVLNLSFSIIFIVEMVVKVYAYGWFGYWMEPANAFDGILVGLILGEFALGSSGISNLRALRLLRVFRVLRSLRCLKLIIQKYKKRNLDKNAPNKVISFSLSRSLSLFSESGFCLFVFVFFTSNDV